IWITDCERLPFFQAKCCAASWLYSVHFIPPDCLVFLFFGTGSASYYRLCGRNIGALRSSCQNAKASGLYSPEACGRAAIWFFAYPHICVRHAGSETGSGG